MDFPNWQQGLLMWGFGFVAVPVALGSLVALLTGASLRPVFYAIVVLALLCFLLGVQGERAWDKRMMVAMIYWMVSCIPGIPIIVVIMRLFGLR